MALGPIAIWALCRVYADGTRFLTQMLYYDVVARSSKAIEGHVGGVGFYVRKLLQARYPQMLLGFVGVFLLLFYKYVKHKARFVPLLSGVLVPFLLFSVAKSKLDWYTWPAYPLILILAAAGLEYILQVMNRKWLKVALLGALIAIHGVVISYTVRNVYHVGLDRNNALTDHIPRLLCRDAQFSKQKIALLDYKGGGRWRQSAFLAVELYGDMLPVHGGYKEFLKPETGYMLVANSELKQIKIAYRIIAQDARYSFIGKW